MDEHEHWIEHTKAGVREVVGRAADERWVSAVALLAALDFEDTLDGGDDDFGAEATPEKARRWGAHYAANVAELPSGL